MHFYHILIKDKIPILIWKFHWRLSVNVQMKVRYPWFRKMASCTKAAILPQPQCVKRSFSSIFQQSHSASKSVLVFCQGWQSYGIRGSMVSILSCHSCFQPISAHHGLGKPTSRSIRHGESNYLGLIPEYMLFLCPNTAKTTTMWFEILIINIIKMHVSKFREEIPNDCWATNA